ncbi:MAG: mechanosensitive ion channel [Candidatus Eisenbacteria bacterium]|uniref:Mechanosensitive ion channel n=1 Tax=Eiseniibacteriota bacterium TaxID=2212470 RepID=A0A956RP79_UNCEI|nr:mechanosensitive ion channel [Candidatus Eisenbacteria bacterium]
MKEWLDQGGDWLLAIGWIALGLLGGWIVQVILMRIASRIARSTGPDWDDLLLSALRGPSRLLLPLLGAMLIAPAMRVPDAVDEFVRHVFSIGLIVAVAWLLVGAVRGLRALVEQRYDTRTADNLHARRVLTQIDVLVKIAVFIVMVITGACILMTFDRVRQVGVSLLASAGIAGIILGFSAQRSLATLFAGIQMAFTQPIRIDDVVIVEGEWGRIEEITLTYVVVRIWDLRRLVVPITYFIDKPFQNWTRVTADLLGTVFLEVDYRLPVDEVRTKLKEILDENDDWDGKTWGVQVTDTSARTMQVRALMSASDASKAWNLRCTVREKLIAWLQSEHPEMLPRVRGEIVGNELPR